MDYDGSWIGAQGLKINELQLKVSGVFDFTPTHFLEMVRQVSSRFSRLVEVDVLWLRLSRALTSLKLLGFRWVEGSPVCYGLGS